MLLLLALLAAPDSSVGIAAFTAIAVRPADTVHAVIWYPSSSAPGDTVLGLQPARVAYDGGLASPGTRYPLVLISHGTGGNEFGHADLAIALVRAGFIVLSVRHPGDNVAESSALGTDRQVFGRSHQVALALEQLLASSRWGPHLDPGRVGFFGFSAGGYTGLTLLGAQPDLHRLTAYCTRHPSATPYCAGGINGVVRLTGSYTTTRPVAGLRAAALAAPALSFLFDSTTLRGITVPLLLARAADDDVVREPDNVMWLAQFVSLAEPVQVIPGGHYIFLAPCSSALTRVAPAICVDPAGVDRAHIHADFDRLLVAYFRRALAAGN